MSGQRKNAASRTTNANNNVIVGLEEDDNVDVGDRLKDAPLNPRLYTGVPLG